MRGQRTEKGAIPRPCPLSLFFVPVGTQHLPSLQPQPRCLCWVSKTAQGRESKQWSIQVKGIWVFVVLFSVRLDIFKLKCWEDK